MRKAKQDNWRYSIVDIEQDAFEDSGGNLKTEDSFYCCGSTVSVSYTHLTLPTKA